MFDSQWGLPAGGIVAPCRDAHPSPIDWSATAAWVQALGSILAIWAAGRVVVVLQQRLARQQVAAEATRDEPVKHGLRGFDGERFTDALAGLTSMTPHDVGDLRLVELLAAYPSMLRTAKAEVEQAGMLTQTGLGPQGGLWERLHDFEQRSATLYAEAGRILTRDQRRVRLWWL